MKLAAVFGAVVLVVGVAVPARADSAEPTNYRSRVTGMDPQVEGLRVEVAGGDSFLIVTADPGTTVAVPGYEGEPYVEIDPDGTVRVNRNSPAYWLNDDRFGRAPVPDTAGAGMTPSWDVVGGNGSYGWHDHRIHWMSPQPPPAVDVGQESTILQWEVPMTVAAQPVTVTGVLEWLPSIPSWPWVLGLLAIAAIVIAVAVSPVGLAVGAAAAVSVGAAQALSSPLGWWSEVPAWLPPVLALVLVGVAVTRRPSLTGTLVAVAAVLVGVWVIQRLPSLWLPVLPTPLPEPIERSLVVVAGATSAAAVAALFRSYLSPVP